MNEIAILKFQNKLKDALLKPDHTFSRTINILNSISPDDQEFKKVIKILVDGIGYVRQRGQRGEVETVRFNKL